MAKKNKTVGKNNTESSGTGKGSLILAVIISLAVGVYLGGVLIPAFKDSAVPPGGPGGPGGPGEISEQIAETKRMAESQPDSAELWAKLGNLYYDTDQHDKAIDAYLKSLKIKPDDPHVLIDLGVMYRRHGQPKKAVEYFDRAIVVSPSHETAFFNKGIVLFYDIKDEAAGLATWKKLVELNPNAKTPNGGFVRDMIRDLSPQVSNGPLKSLSQ